MASAGVPVTGCGANRSGDPVRLVEAFQGEAVFIGRQSFRARCLWLLRNLPRLLAK